MTRDFDKYYGITVSGASSRATRGGFVATVDVFRRDTQETVWSGRGSGRTSNAARTDAMNAGTSWCQSNPPPANWNG